MTNHRKNKKNTQIVKNQNQKEQANFFLRAPASSLFLFSFPFLSSRVRARGQSLVFFFILAPLCHALCRAANHQYQYSVEAAELFVLSPQGVVLVHELREALRVLVEHVGHRRLLVLELPQHVQVEVLHVPLDLLPRLRQQPNI